MEKIHFFLRWLADQDDIKQLVIILMFVILLVWLGIRLSRVLVFMLRLAFRKKKPILEKTRDELTDEELAIIENDILAEGLSVYIFNYETKELHAINPNRYLSSREIGDKPYWQIRAINEEQALFKFKNLLKQHGRE